ncbi:MAG: peptidoglycan editing factor PgeF [Nitrospiraceae bacterium]
MSAAVITIPAFARNGDGINHFFGTRHQFFAGMDGPTPGRATRLKKSEICDPGFVGDAKQQGRSYTFVSVKQVHGTDALVLDRPLKGDEIFDGGWDALVTDQPGVLVTVRTADCVPVLLYDPVRHVIAAVHAGWRGAVAGIVPKTLALMRSKFETETATVSVGIGPSVGPCCYEVDEPVLRPLRQQFPDWRRVINEHESEKGKGFLDLRGLIRYQVEAAGVREARVFAAQACTVCHPDLFFSYRREGTVKGTMVSGIALVHTQ